jgi:hypothetical protein
MENYSELELNELKVSLILDGCSEEEADKAIEEIIKNQNKNQKRPPDG